MEYPLLDAFVTMMWFFHGSAGELVKLVDLRAHGLITESEFQQGKARILA